MEIRVATKEDALRFNMREEDKDSFRSVGYTGTDGLLASLSMSEHCWAIEDKGKLLGMSGVAPNDKGATLWIMFDADLTSLPLSFFKESKKYVKFMLDKYGYLENYAAVDKTFVMNWARSMGFTVDAPFSTPRGEYCRVHIGGY